jgi:L-ribulose-5-phosphate 4-epimerase
MDEGYIKFKCHLIKDAPLAAETLTEINLWRDKLYKLGLIGVYDNGVGFGNISIRAKGNTFIITGSSTGHFARLNENHYVLVEAYDFAQNSLTCRGPIKASSESLSHAAVYESSPETMAVIHIHNLTMWQRLMDQVPTTHKDIAFGTPEMANDIQRLLRESDFRGEGLIVMGGHEEGIITFGKTLAAAGSILLNRFEKLK